MNGSLKPYDSVCSNCPYESSKGIVQEIKENTHGRYFRIICPCCGAKSKWKRI